MTIQDEANRVTEQVFALREPWRGRFLDYIALYAQNGHAAVDRKRVNAWLRDPNLRTMVEALLRAWPS